MVQNVLFTRRSTLALGAGVLTLSRFAHAAPRPKVLVELFTSQGCSSCPPADRLAGEMLNDPDTLVLSLNVDYWDYLGWKDTLAKPEYTQRQYDYARHRGDGSVYTPQMIVGGAAHVVGSKKRDVNSEVDVARDRALSVQVDVAMTKEKVSVDIAKADFNGTATLWLMAVAPRLAQKIERGENAGEDIVYHNVVRKLVSGGSWSGDAFNMSWALGDVMTDDSTFVVAVVQQDSAGPVLGFARS